MNEEYKKEFLSFKEKGDKYENECLIYIRSGESIFGIVDFADRLIDTTNQMKGIDIRIKSTSYVPNTIHGVVTIKNTTNIDCKFRSFYYDKMKRTEYGVDLIPIEFYKYDNSISWGLNMKLETTYLIMHIENVCSYVINSLALRSYLNHNKDKYPIWKFKREKSLYHQVRGVSVEDLLNLHIIVNYRVY